MKHFIQIFLTILATVLCACGKENMAGENLTPQERAVVFGKATERPFSGKYDKFFGDGIYTCKVCNAPLYKSEDKFDSGCGWPAFDSAFPMAIKEVPDADGMRTEIQCARCGAHLGHVFKGEMLTKKNLRYCVNSISMNFIPKENIETAIVAGGCFWGVEELMRKQNGVIGCVSGYIGGNVENPSYQQVCTGKTGHLEAVEVIFDKTKISYSEIIKRFFEIHNFTQKNGQGNDIGQQYLSAIFVENHMQEEVADSLIDVLKSRGYDVATKVLPAKTFYPAENYHQRYYERTGKSPYCHIYKPIAW